MFLPIWFSNESSSWLKEIYDAFNQKLVNCGSDLIALLLLFRLSKLFCICSGGFKFCFVPIVSSQWIHWTRLFFHLFYFWVRYGSVASEICMRISKFKFNRKLALFKIENLLSSQKKKYCISMKLPPFSSSRPDLRPQPSWKANWTIKEIIRRGARWQ